MLDDEGRGYLMELMITKLLLLQQDIQIIGMSATLSVRLLLRADCRRWNDVDQACRIRNSWRSGYAGITTSPSTGPSP